MASCHMGSAADFPAHLRVCELFAGIGGWRVALEAMLPAGVRAEFAAHDSGPHCSEVYALNFQDQCCRRNIEQLEPKDLEGFDVWAMSPPCQPFSTTREAKQLDTEDRRCKALGHLCSLLPRLAAPPRWIILENVKGFYASDACERWRAALAEAGYSGHELLLDLASFGAPNHRTRYYLLAERCGGLPSLLRERGAPGGCGPREARLGAEVECAGEIGEATGEVGAAPSPPSELLPPGVLATGPWARIQRAEIEAAHRAARASKCRDAQEAIFRELRADFCRALAVACPSLAQGVQGALSGAAESSEWKLLPLPRSQADAFLMVFDANRASARRLFADAPPTGAAAGVSWSWVESTAEAPRCLAEYLLEDSLSAAERAELLVPRSVLERPFARGLSYVEPRDVQSFCFTGHYGKVLHKSSGSLLHLPGSGPLDRSQPAASHGSVRFFSPREILNIFGFPRGFLLPLDMELRHRYKVVGNSIAVTVASTLLRVLLLREDGSRVWSHRQPLHGVEPRGAAGELPGQHEDGA